MARVTDRLMSGAAVGDLELPSSMRVRPTGGPVGAVVEGVELAEDLTGEVVGGLVRVFNHAGLMIVPGQDRLDPERQAEVATWFGRPFSRGMVGFGDGSDKLPNVGGGPVQLLANVDPARYGSTVQGAVSGRPGEKGKPRDSAHELTIHSDVQDYAQPPDLTILHGVQVPPVAAGGNTYFYNLYQAYDELDDITRALVGGLRWRPRTSKEVLRLVSIGLEAFLAEEAERGARGEEPPERSEVRHPVARTHPVTGRKALWLSPDMTAAIDGLPPSESDKLVRRLFGHVAADHLVYTHEWTPHDVLFWDNRCVNHRRDAWDPSYERIMHRAQAGGSKPF